MAMPPSATLVVGPEGGWTEDEIRVASEVGTLVTLGGRTLRADAMALVALSALFTHWREF
jgi:16S rRNA (uracil1498-N3)-methyltransferase